MRAIGRPVITALLATSFLVALAFSVLPRLHELIHPDANAPWHECAITLIHSGNYQQPAPAPILVAPAPVLQICFVPVLRPVWVASPFLGAHIFAHAPPVFA